MSTRRKCKLCGRPLLIVRDVEGKLQHLDLAAPVFRVSANLLGEEIANVTDCLAAHFSTCPKAHEALAKGKPHAAHTALHRR